MSEPAQRRMTSDEFIAWAMEQPEAKHYELINGEIVTMAPERASHVRAKARIWRRLEDAIEAARLPCEALTDGMSVEVDGHTVYEPDALVRCGEPLPPNSIKLSDPVIIVEVQSPSTSSRDVRRKLVDYFQLPSLRHYLIMIAEDRTIIHHARGDNGIILTRIVRDEPIILDPPGITLTDCFPPGVA